MGLGFYFNAFMDLDTCRPVGFGAARIPWTATDLYCDRLGLGLGEREDMFYFIRMMDVTYCEHKNKKKG